MSIIDPYQHIVVSHFESSVYTILYIICLV